MMRRTDRSKVDPVEELVSRTSAIRGTSDGLEDVGETPEDFKGAPKTRRDRASQLVQRYGKHST